MKALDLKPQHQTNVIAQILNAKNQIDYHKKEIRPFLYQMEKWEQKEYLSVFEAEIQKIGLLKDCLVKNESLFNKILCEYNLSVAIFVNKYCLMLEF